MKHAAAGFAQIGVGSRPARGAWIETVHHLLMGWTLVVAPRTGRVD